MYKYTYPFIVNECCTNFVKVGPCFICDDRCRKALIRYAAKRARKANLVVCCYGVTDPYITIRLCSIKDRNRLKHFLDMLGSKRARKILVASNAYSLSPRIVPDGWMVPTRGLKRSDGIFVYDEMHRGQYNYETGNAEWVE